MSICTLCMHLQKQTLYETLLTIMAQFWFCFYGNIKSVQPFATVSEHCSWTFSEARGVQPFATVSEHCSWTFSEARGLLLQSLSTAVGHLVRLGV